MKKRVSLFIFSTTVVEILLLVLATTAFAFMSSATFVSAQPEASILPIATDSAARAAFQQGKLFMRVNYEGEEKVAQWLGPVDPTRLNGKQKGILAGGKEITW